MRHLLYTFPFEGNWNLTISRSFIIHTLYLLYTFPFEGNWNLDTCPYRGVAAELAIHFPVWRELKQTPLVELKNTLTRACYTLSRLKGIETLGRMYLPAPSLRTCYTLSRLKGIETGRCCHVSEGRIDGLLYTFPFEGNWNAMTAVPKPRQPSCYTLSRLKGIETNVICSEHKMFNTACYTLSRLKGIETLVTHVDYCNPLSLLYTFPFEGNWNFVR